MKGNVLHLFVYILLFVIVQSENFELCTISPSDPTCSGYTYVSNNLSAVVYIEDILKAPIGNPIACDVSSFYGDDFDIILINGSTGQRLNTKEYNGVPILYVYSDTSIIITTNSSSLQYVNYVFVLEQIGWKWYGLLAALGVFTYFFYFSICICTLPCCCCCAPDNKRIPYYKRQGPDSLMYVFKDPIPLTDRQFPKFLSLFGKKPVVEFIVYFLNNNDIMWIYYPEITESLTIYGRVYVTFLNILCVFTFQGILAIKLLGGMQNNWSFVKTAVTYVVVLLFRTILKLAFRKLSRRPNEMFFSLSSSPVLRILGMIMNYAIFFSSLAISALCIWEIYISAKQEIAFLLYNFFIFAAALAGRLIFPGPVFNYATFMIFKTIGAYPEAIIENDIQHMAQYVRGIKKEDDLNSLPPNYIPLSLYLSSSPIHSASLESRPLLSSPSPSSVSVYQENK